MAGEGSSFWGLNYCAIGHRRNQISLIKEQFGVHIFGLALLSYSESFRFPIDICASLALDPTIFTLQVDYLNFHGV